MYDGVENGEASNAMGLAGAGQRALSLEDFATDRVHGTTLNPCSCLLGRGTRTGVREVGPLTHARDSDLAS